QMVRDHMQANEFSEREYKLFEGAVGPRTGIALFPVSDDSSVDWGMRPVFLDDHAQADAFLANPQPDYRGVTFRKYDRVPCFTLADLIGSVDHVDVMHIDIQGGEYDLVLQNLELLKQRVGYLAIGTHGRDIEGQLIQTLRAAGWK